MPAITLNYFDARGVVEVTRFMLSAAGVEYTDNRYPMTFGVPGDFSTISRPEFDAAKAAGELDLNLGRVPVLVVDGVQIGQSKAIERYVAKQFGMMGSTDIEAALIDCLTCHIIDIKDAYNKAKNAAGSDPEAKEAAMKKWFEEDLPQWLVKVEKTVTGPGPYLVGDKISLADFQYYQFLLAPSGFFDNTEGAAAAMKDCPKIKAAVEAVHVHPGVTAWVGKRRASMF